MLTMKYTPNLALTIFFHNSFICLNFSISNKRNAKLANEYRKDFVFFGLETVRVKEMSGKKTNMKFRQNMQFVLLIGCALRRDDHKNIHLFQLRVWQEQQKKTHTHSEKGEKWLWIRVAAHATKTMNAESNGIETFEEWQIRHDESLIISFVFRSRVKRPMVTFIALSISANIFTA